MGDNARMTPRPIAQVSLGHPLATGLVACSIAGHGRDLVTGLAHVASPYSTTKFGVAQTDVGVSSASFLPTAASATAMVVFRSVAASQAWGVASASLGVRFGGHISFGGAIYFDFGGAAGNQRVSVSGPDYLSDRVWVFVVRPAALEIWHDGNRVAVGSGAPSARTAGGTGFGINGPYNDSAANGGVGNGFSVWNRDLSANEIAMLTHDPWCYVEED